MGGRGKKAGGAGGGAAAGATAAAALPATKDEAIQQAIATNTGDFNSDFNKNFDLLDNYRENGEKRKTPSNYVLASDLRASMPSVSREDFDRKLNQLRRDQKFSMDAADGRHLRLTPAQVAGGIREAGANLTYVARR